jgi:FkbM family methyltransferase
MSSNVYLDCGAHFGEGLLRYSRQYGMDDSWKIYSFEPNKESFKKLTTNPEITLKVNYINKALWLYDGRVTFNAEIMANQTVAEGTGSSIIPLSHWHPKSEINPSAGDIFDSYDVDSVDLSAFILNNFKPDDFIVMKLDVEGAEFDILRKMLKDGSMAYINHIYIEFHSWAYSGESIENRDALIKQILEAGVFYGDHI